MSNLLTVWGATGNQGGSVISAVLADPVLSKQFKIRGVTRDVSKPAAKALTDKGVEMVKADMASAEAAAPAVKGAHTVFLVTNFWETMSDETEIAQGKAVTDACKAAGVQHLIFSSLINTTEASNGKLPNISHFVGKSKIEEYIRASGVPCTFVLPGMFMSNLLTTIKKGEDGNYMFAGPFGEDTAQMPLFDVNADTGNFVKAALKHYPSGGGKHILAATDYYTPKRLLADFSEVMGKPAKFMKLDNETFKSFLPPPVAQELLENFLLVESPGYYAGASLAESIALLDSKPKAWKTYVEENKEKWL